jgi:hypothetical protein
VQLQSHTFKFGYLGKVYLVHPVVGEQMWKLFRFSFGSSLVCGCKQGACSFFGWMKRFGNNNAFFVSFAACR